MSCDSIQRKAAQKRPSHQKIISFWSVLTIWSVIIMLTLGIFAKSGQRIEAAPKNLGTSTSTSALGSQSQKKTFFDSINSMHWSFYYDGTEIVYSYSSDGETWTDAGNLTYNTSNFSLSYKAISGSGYVFFATECNTYDICVRRGTLDSNSITFGAEITIFNGSSGSDKYSKPSISLDQNNYIWVVAVKDFGLTWADHLQVFASRSTAVNNVSAWDPATNIGRRSSSINELTIMPQTGSEMYLIMNSDYPNIVGYKYNGSSWSAANDGGDYSWFHFPSGVDSYVNAILVDGNDVYLGGHFSSVDDNWDNYMIVRWNMIDGGWHPLAGGITGSDVKSIKKDGTDIYIGGSISAAYDKDGNTVAGAVNIIRYDTLTNTWNALGSGVNNVVYAIDVVGDDIYAGGTFTSASGVASTGRIARYNTISQTWNAMDGGMAAGQVSAITHNGTDVYVGGTFTNIDGDANADYAVRYDDLGWHALNASPLSSFVNALHIWNGKLVVGGFFQNAGGIAIADYLAALNIGTASWEAVGASAQGNQVFTITSSGSDLYIGGQFTNAGGNADADYVAKFDGASWSAVTPGLNSYVKAIALVNNQIYLGGNFSTLSTAEGNASYAAFYDGSEWHGIKYGSFDGNVNAVAVYGTDVYVGGVFSSVAGVANTNNLARYDTIDGTWHDVGGGLVAGNTYDIKSIKVISPTDIYIGGSFDDAGGDLNADNLAHFNGTSWSSIGGQTLNGTVYAVLVDGDNVYIGGSFNNVGGDANADYVMRWDKSNLTWNKLSNTPLNFWVYALGKVGSDIYIGGGFTNVAGDANADYIIRWDGAWHTLGGSAVMNRDVMCFLTDGTDLYIGGQFTDAGIADGDRIVRLDTTDYSWHAVGTGLGNPGSVVDYVASIAKNGNDLIVGGWLPDTGLERFNGTSWSEIGDFYNVYAIDNIGEDFYVGSENQKYFGKVGRAAVNDSNVASKVSSVSDTSGNIHMTYVNQNDDLIYKEYSAASDTWGLPVILRTGTTSAPSLSYDPGTGDLYAFWVEANKVDYKKAVTPYADANWDASPTEFYGTGTNFNLVTDQQLEDGILKITWENGDAAPYTVYSDYLGGSTPAPVNHAPNPPAQLTQTIGGENLQTGSSIETKNITFSALVSDPDNPDNLSLCLEKKPIGVAFGNSEDTCSDPVAYTGSGAGTTIALTNIPLGEYHWQARVKDQAGAYSSWLSFGGNDEAVKDFGIVASGNNPPITNSTNSTSVAVSVTTTSSSNTTNPEVGVSVANSSDSTDNIVPAANIEKATDPITILSKDTPKEQDKSSIPKSIIETLKSNLIKLARIFFGTVVGITALGSLLDASFVDIWSYLYRFFLTLLEILGLRKKRTPWGVVYDSVTKSPVDLSIIRAFDVDTGKLIETNVTDKWGRFGLLLLPGRYNIKVRKDRYNWTSKIVPPGTEKDDVYSNIYHGAQFDITQEKSLANFDIPVDPINFKDKWFGNFSRLFHAYTNSSLVYLLPISVALSILSFIVFRKGIDIGMSGLGLLFLFYHVTDKRRHFDWGIVYDSVTKKPVSGAIIKIFDSLTDRPRHLKVTDQFGRFGFLVPPSDYSLRVEKTGYNYPSKIVVQKNDNQFHNVYHGEVLKKDYPDTLITANIPIDKQSE